MQWRDSRSPRGWQDAGKVIIILETTWPWGPSGFRRTGYSASRDGPVRYQRRRPSPLPGTRTIHKGGTGGAVTGELMATHDPNSETNKERNNPGKWAALFRQPEMHVLLFCIGFVLLNYPVLHILHSSRLECALAGIIVIWACAIFLLALIARSCRTEHSGETAKNRQDSP